MGGGDFGGIGPDDDEDDDDELEEDSEDEEEAEDFEDQPTESPVEARLRRLEQENEDLRRSIPPVQPRQAAPEPEPVDWGTMLYADPEKTLQLHGEMIEKRVTQRLKAEYQQEQNRNKFWEQFYSSHGDLRAHEDMVEMVLGRNMVNLANMRSADAMDKLADLTRQRIMQLSGKRPRKKAIAEGGGPPSRRAAPAKQDEASVSSISDFIKQRRANKRKGLTAA
jgi:hypothetical protein